MATNYAKTISPMIYNENISNKIKKYSNRGNHKLHSSVTRIQNQIENIDSKKLRSSLNSSVQQMQVTSKNIARQSSAIISNTNNLFKTSINRLNDISLGTMKLAKDSMTDLSKSMTEDINVHKSNTLMLSFAQISPFIGYTLKKAVESGVYDRLQDFASEKIKNIKSSIFRGGNDNDEIIEDIDDFSLPSSNQKRKTRKKTKKKINKSSIAKSSGAHITDKVKQIKNKSRVRNIQSNKHALDTAEILVLKSMDFKLEKIHSVLKNGIIVEAVKEIQRPKEIGGAKEKKIWKANLWSMFLSWQRSSTLQSLNVDEQSFYQSRFASKEKKKGILPSAIRAYRIASDESTLSVQEKMLKALLEMNKSISGTESVWKLVADRLMIEHAALRNVVWALQKTYRFVTTPFRIYKWATKSRGGYHSKLPSGLGSMEHSAAVLDMIYTDGMWRLDNIVFHLKQQYNLWAAYVQQTNGMEFSPIQDVSKGTWQYMRKFSDIFKSWKQKRQELNEIPEYAKYKITTNDLLEKQINIGKTQVNLLRKIADCVCVATSIAELSIPSKLLDKIHQNVNIENSELSNIKETRADERIRADKYITSSDERLNEWKVEQILERKKANKFKKIRNKIDSIKKKTNDKIVNKQVRERWYDFRKRHNSAYASMKQGLNDELLDTGMNHIFGRGYFTAKRKIGESYNNLKDNLGGTPTKIGDTITNKITSSFRNVFSETTSDTIRGLRRNKNDFVEKYKAIRLVYENPDMFGNLSMGQKMMMAHLLMRDKSKKAKSKIGNLLRDTKRGLEKNEVYRAIKTTFGDTVRGVKQSTPYKWTGSKIYNMKEKYKRVTKFKKLMDQNHPSVRGMSMGDFSLGDRAILKFDELIRMGHTKIRQGYSILNEARKRTRILSRIGGFFKKGLGFLWNILKKGAGFLFTTLKNTFGGVISKVLLLGETLLPVVRSVGAKALAGLIANPELLGPIGGLLWGGVDAYRGVKKAKEWGTSKTAAGIGGFLGGAGEGGVGSALAGASKGLMMGAMFGPPGMLIGAAIGGIAGALGGKNIAKALDWMAEKLKPLKDLAVKYLIDPIFGIYKWIGKTLWSTAKFFYNMIFHPIDTIKGVGNKLKNWLIDDHPWIAGLLGLKRSTKFAGADRTGDKTLTQTRLEQNRQKLVSDIGSAEFGLNDTETWRERSKTFENQRKHLTPLTTKQIEKSKKEEKKGFFSRMMGWFSSDDKKEEIEAAKKKAPVKLPEKPKNIDEKKKTDYLQKAINFSKPVAGAIYNGAIATAGFMMSGASDAYRVGSSFLQEHNFISKRSTAEEQANKTPSLDIYRYVKNGLMAAQSFVSSASSPDGIKKYYDDLLKKIPDEEKQRYKETILKAKWAALENYNRANYEVPEWFGKDTIQKSKNIGDYAQKIVIPFKEKVAKPSENILHSYLKNFSYVDTPFGNKDKYSFSELGDDKYKEKMPMSVKLSRDFSSVWNKTKQGTNDFLTNHPNLKSTIGSIQSAGKAVWNTGKNVYENFINNIPVLNDSFVKLGTTIGNLNLVINNLRLLLENKGILKKVDYSMHSDLNMMYKEKMPFDVKMYRQFSSAKEKGSNFLKSGLEKFNSLLPEDYDYIAKFNNMNNMQYKEKMPKMLQLKYKLESIMHNASDKKKAFEAYMIHKQLFHPTDYSMHSDLDMMYKNEKPLSMKLNSVGDDMMQKAKSMKKRTSTGFFSNIFKSVKSFFGFGGDNKSVQAKAKNVKKTEEISIPKSIQNTAGKIEESDDVFKTLGIKKIKGFIYTKDILWHLSKYDNDVLFNKDNINELSDFNKSLYLYLKAKFGNPFFVDPKTFNKRMNNKFDASLIIKSAFRDTMSPVLLKDKLRYDIKFMDHYKKSINLKEIKNVDNKKANEIIGSLKPDNKQKMKKDNSGLTLISSSQYKNKNNSISIEHYEGKASDYADVFTRLGIKKIKGLHYNDDVLENLETYDIDVERNINGINNLNTFDKSLYLYLNSRYYGELVSPKEFAQNMKKPGLADKIIKAAKYSYRSAAFLNMNKLSDAKKLKIIKNEKIEYSQYNKPKATPENFIGNFTVDSIKPNKKNKAIETHSSAPALTGNDLAHFQVQQKNAEIDHLSGKISSDINKNTDKIEKSSKQLTNMIAQSHTQLSKIVSNNITNITNNSTSNNDSSSDEKYDPNIENILLCNLA